MLIGPPRHRGRSPWTAKSPTRRRADASKYASLIYTSCGEPGAARCCSR
ncbi:hypothetical protein ACPA9J_16825 [Pseudomonas aeruginosa]